MKRPGFSTMILGHPLVATPLTLAGGVGLFASLYGNAGLFPAVVCGTVAVTTQRASEQAGKFRAWQADWDSMGDGPPRRKLTPAPVILTLLAIALLVVAVGEPRPMPHFAHRTLRWLIREPWVLGGVALIAGVLLAQFIRCYPRRPKLQRPVTVIAKPILPVPSLADAYRALPPYCHALLRGHK